MNIKSDNKERFDYSKFFSDMGKTFQKSYMRGMLISLLMLMAWISWTTFSGLLAVWIGILSTILLLNRKESYLDNFGISLIFFVGLAVLGTANVYNTEPIEKTMKIEKYEFMPQSEKLVVTISEPSKRVLILNKMDSKQFFTLRNEDGKTMTGVIKKEFSYDHWDKILYKSEPSDNQWRVSIDINGVKYSQDYCEGYNGGGCSSKKCPDLFK